MRDVVIKILKEALKKSKLSLSEKEISKLIEIPPNSEMGDYAFPTFALVGKLHHQVYPKTQNSGAKKAPNQIALDIRKEVSKLPKGIEEIQTSGPYLNFFVNRKTLAEDLIKEILKQKDNFGKSKIGKGKKILVEFSSPNIAKPFGIGHLRSTIIGNSLANICDFVGFKTIRMNYLGDWGTQFGKMIVGYKKFGNEAKLKEDSTKHLLEVYVKANKKIYEKQSREWFRKLEQGDKEATKLWKKFNQLSMKKFNEIYKLLGVRFDVTSGESMYNKKMQGVKKELQKKNLLEESEGALIVDLKKFNLGVSLIQKSDGATLYATRDLAAAIDRYSNYKFAKMIYEVGQEQKLHFRQFFKVLELMGNKWAKDCIHIDHGLYLDADGKRFATRKGKTIFMENIIDETKSLASKEIKKRFPKVSKSELGKRSLKVAIAAIFYGDLKNNRKNNIIFDLKRFVSFEGDTGPYIQYSYARANSIIKKAKVKALKQISVKKLEQKEVELVKKLSQFSEVVLNAYKNLNPSAIANYSYQLAQTFNEFYHACPVIGSDNQNFRISLVESFKQIIKNSLGLLGIETLEEM
jgi:arginyl-tRNA synthetase